MRFGTQLVTPGHSCDDSIKIPLEKHPLFMQVVSRNVCQRSVRRYSDLL
jgi:hypothetical protein